MIDIKTEITEKEFFRYPCLSVTPIGITAYTQVVNKKGDHINKVRGEKPPVDHKTNGFISQKGQSNIQKAVNWFLYSVDPLILIEGKNRHKVTFLTLTLQAKQRHSDKEIKEKCLNQFLTEIRNEYQVTKYIWKAEKQEQGQLHFHLLTDKFLPYSEMLEKWNRIINKLGYVWDYHLKMSKLTWEQYRDLRLKEIKGKPTDKQKKQIQKAWRKGVSNDWMCPNSVDVESLKKAKNVAAYIGKYMSKEHKKDWLTDAEKERLKVDGRIWFSSQAISKMKNLQIELINRDEYVEEFTHMLETYSQKIYETDYIVNLGVPIDQLAKKGYNIIPCDWWEWCDYVLGKKEMTEDYKHANRNDFIKSFEDQKEEKQPIKEEVIKPKYEQLNLPL